MSKIIIIGRGPAGISAALYTQRANLDTLLLARDGGALGKADKIENYYGFAEPVSAGALLEAGAANARRLGCTLLDREAVGISYDGVYTVQTAGETYAADTVILATGAARSRPKLEGITELEGRGVSYCAVCDAFFYRGKDVAVLGGGEYALHEAMELLPVASSVTLLTNGARVEVSLPEGLRADERKLGRLEGSPTLSKAVFADGSQLPLAGLFVALGVASSSDLARKLGAEVAGSRIVVNERMETSLPGLYAAGDCTGGLLQIAKAVCEGAVAGTEAIKFIRKNGK